MVPRQGARVHHKVPAWLGCWEGAWVRPRSPRDGGAPSAWGGLSLHSGGRGRWEAGASLWGNGRQCDCSLRARLLVLGATFVISHTPEPSLPSPNAVPAQHQHRPLPLFPSTCRQRNIVDASRNLTVQAARVSLGPGGASPRRRSCCWDRALDPGRAAGVAGRGQGASRAQGHSSLRVVGAPRDQVFL